MIYAGGYLWVTNLPGSVTQIDASTGVPVRVITGCGLTGIRNIAADANYLWVTDTDSNAVTKLNLSDGSCVGSYSGAGYSFDLPYGVLSDGSHVWVTNLGTTPSSDSITVLNASDGSVVSVLSDPAYGFQRPVGIASDGTNLWVSNSDGNSLSQIRLSDNAPIRTVSGLNLPDDITIDGTHVWVTNIVGNPVVEFDSSSGALLKTFDAPTNIFSGPLAPTVVNGYVYIANANGNFLSRVPA